MNQQQRLDPIAEFEVYNNFDKLVGGKTAVYISHRLSSCRFCDRIIVFDGGTIIEDGSHDKLMENQKASITICTIHRQNTTKIKNKYCIGLWKCEADHNRCN